MKKMQPQAASQQLRHPATNPLVRLKRSVGSAGDDYNGDAKKSGWKRSEGKLGSFKHTAGKWSGDPDDKEDMQEEEMRPEGGVVDLDVKQYADAASGDYVTCIQFNHVDDIYFISGSLDEKVRIWSIHDRKVVDWNDLYEMVTAVCYTPNGQSALLSSHKGSCHRFGTSDNKLHHRGQIDLRNKKKKSVCPRKFL